jgi:uncharacterized Tic20 family protein
MGLIEFQEKRAKANKKIVSVEIKGNNMLLRKINAALSLLTTVLLLNHAVFLAIWMITNGGIEKSSTPVPWVLMWIVALHAIISIVLAVLGHRNAEKRKCNSYPKLNRGTMIQRVSGILMLAFIPLHVLSAVGVTSPPKLVHIIFPPLFFAIVLSHVAVSTSKALITLGIGNAKAVKIVDVIIKALCAVTLITAMIGFCLYAV